MFIIENIINPIVLLFNRMISNIQSMELSAYVVLAVVLVLLLMVLVFRRIKFLSWLFLFISSSVCVYMLYYVIADIKILLFIRINNVLSGIDTSILQIVGVVVLGLILIIGLVSIIIGMVRGKSGKQVVD